MIDCAPSLLFCGQMTASMPLRSHNQSNLFVTLFSSLSSDVTPRGTSVALITREFKVHASVLVVLSTFLRLQPVIVAQVDFT